MIEQSPSAGSLWIDLLEKDDRTSPEEYPDMALITFDEFEYLLNHYAAQRVSAETVSWQNWDRQRLEQISRLQETVQSLQSARAERPEDGTKLWLWKNGDHFLAYAHEYPTYGGGDPMVLGEPAGWAIFKTSSPPATGPHAGDFARCLHCVSHELTRDVCWYAGRCLRQATASPAAAVDYTERALQAARDAVESVPSELWIDRRNSEVIAQAIAPDFAEFASAVASEVLK